MEGVGVGGDMLVALMLPARCHSKCSTLVRSRVAWSITCMYYSRVCVCMNVLLASMYAYYVRTLYSTHTCRTLVVCIVRVYT